MALPYTLHLGDCLEVLKSIPDNSIDSVVTDPPYGLTANKKGGSGAASSTLENPYGRARIGTGNGAGGFMGMKWDSDVPPVEVWTECLRVLKPGGHLLAFAGTRTQHRMAARIEDAGFEIRDMIAWVYGSGFPKSKDVRKAISSTQDESLFDEAGNPLWCEQCGEAHGTIDMEHALFCRSCAAEEWNGWGTALKPALEPITVARKPLVNTVAANVLEHGTGAMNIDECRVSGVAEGPGTTPSSSVDGRRSSMAGAMDRVEYDGSKGRWPANLIHDGSNEVVALFPSEAGQAAALKTRSSDKTRNTFGAFGGTPDAAFTPHDAGGSAARFFYCAKASRSDRNEGLPTADQKAVSTNATMRQIEDADWSDRNGNHHPTVKPTDLMAYLCRLVTRPGGVVLDPFMGSGSTGKACMREGFQFIGIEREAPYLAIAEARIAYALECAEAVAEEAIASAAQLDIFNDTKEPAA